MFTDNNGGENPNHFEVFRIEMNSDEVSNGHLEKLVNNLIHYKLFINEIHNTGTFKISIYRFESDDNGVNSEQIKTAFLIKTSNYQFIKHYLRDFNIKSDIPESLTNSKFILTV